MYHIVSKFGWTQPFSSILTKKEMKKGATHQSSSVLRIRTLGEFGSGSDLSEKEELDGSGF